MSRLIDAKKYEIDLLKAYDDISIELDVLDKQPTVDAIIIPKGATNGDIFTSIYKPYKVQKHTLCVSIYRTEHDFKQGIEWLVFVSSWWNAPYMVEREE